jgi:hypothetical protein
MSSHERIPQETEKDEGDDEKEDDPVKLMDQEEDTCEHGDDEYQEIRKDLPPRYRHPVELLRSAPRKKQGAQPAFAERTGFTVIVTVHAMATQQPEFEEKDEQHIPGNPDEAEPVEDRDTGSVDQDREKI